MEGYLGAAALLPDHINICPDYFWFLEGGIFLKSGDGVSAKVER